MHRGRRIDLEKNRHHWDLDFTGSRMPPPDAVKAGKVKPLTDEDRRTLVRWIDLGCPVDLDYDAKQPERAGRGWMLDDNRPVLTLTTPAAGKNAELSRLLIGMYDYGSGLDRDSFHVVADFAVDGVAAGEDLAGHFKEKAQGVWEWRLAKPLTKLAGGTLRQSAHIGRLGEYAEAAAANKMAFLATVNSHGHGRRVAPPGGTTGRISTNPLCMGVPTANDPIVLDMGTSVVAEGKVRVFFNKGQKVPEGWLLDEKGRLLDATEVPELGGKGGGAAEVPGRGVPLIHQLDEHDTPSAHDTAMLHRAEDGRIVIAERWLDFNRKLDSKIIAHGHALAGILVMVISGVVIVAFLIGAIGIEARENECQFDHRIPSFDLAFDAKTAAAWW